MDRYTIRVRGTSKGTYPYRDKITYLETMYSSTKPNKITINKIADKWNYTGSFYSIAISVEDTESNYEANYII